VPIHNVNVTGRKIKLTRGEADCEQMTWSRNERLPRKERELRLKSRRKLHKALTKEAKKKDVDVSELALAISERGIRKEKKSEA
jgi:hypothetical protein